MNLPLTKKNIRNMFCRIIEDCDKCMNKEDVKANILQEAGWLGFRINDKRRK